MKKLEIKWCPTKDLKPYANNAKIHSDEQIDKIAAQIKEFGFDQPIVVDKKKVIIKGHGRYKAAQRLGLKEVPVIVSTLDKFAAMAARIGDNKVAEAPWDPELLKIELGALQLQEFDLGLTAIDHEMIAGILEPPTSDTLFTERDHQSVKERKEDYDQSDLRQIILVTDPESFEELMEKFASLQEKFGVETNIEVVEKLIEFYESEPQEDAED